MPETTAPASGGFPQTAVDAYLEDCAKDPGDLEFCRCTVREFEERLSSEEFVGIEPGDGGVVLEVAAVCMEETGMMADLLEGPGDPLPVPDTLQGYADLTILAIEAYWEAALPDTYGIAYEGVGRTIPYFPSTGDLPGCGTEDIDPDLFVDNAFYCLPDDYVAWDAEGLMPGLYAEFGDFAVALVLAHEWGHAVQARAEVLGPTIVTELQADCFAGSWAAHVAAEESELLSLQPGDLEEAMAGYLLFRDPPGTSPNDPQAHGSAFDRVTAFQDGFLEGPARCRAYEDGDFTVVSLTLTREDLVTGGNLPFTDTAPLLTATLETFWSVAFPELFGTEWEPMSDFGPYLPSTGVLPPCGTVPVDTAAYTNEAFYCAEDDFVAWDNETFFPGLWREIGDFAIGVLLAHEWANAAQFRAGLAIEGVDAELQADCLAGSWAAAMIGGIPILLEDGTQISILLSAGDLDEAVATFLLFGDAPGATAVAGSAFERFEAFQEGFIEGAGRCLAGSD